MPLDPFIGVVAVVEVRRDDFDGHLRVYISALEAPLI